MFDLYVLIIPDRYDVKEKVRILGLEDDGIVSPKNFNKHNTSVGYGLYEREVLDDLILFGHDQIPSCVE